MKSDETKSDRKPTARNERVALAQQYQELLELRRELLSLEKNEKQRKRTSVPSPVNP
jgi:hypothetical protein